MKKIQYDALLKYVTRTFVPISSFLFFKKQPGYCKQYIARLAKYYLFIIIHTKVVINSHIFLLLSIYMYRKFLHPYFDP